MPHDTLYLSTVCAMAAAVVRRAMPDVFNEYRMSDRGKVTGSIMERLLLLSCDLNLSKNFIEKCTF